MNEVAAQSPPNLETLIKRSAYTERFKEVLGQRAPQFMSSLLSVGKSMPDVEPRSIIASAMVAAVLDLPIEKNFGFAWIVPYRDGAQKYAQFQMGHKGFIQLALRTGSYSRMNARRINKDAFSGWDEVGEPVIQWDKINDDEPAIGYAFAFKLTNGFSKICYWPKSRVEAHAKRYSQSFRGGKGSPWQTHFDEMALKTVVKNELSDWGILSVDFRRAVTADQAIQKTPEDEPQYPDTGPLELVEHVPAETKQAEAPKPAEDQIPGAEVPAKPAQAPTATANATGESQAALEQFVVKECGHNFSTLQRFAIESGWINDADSLGSFAEVPTAICNRFLKAKAGLKKGLDKIAAK